MPVTFTLVPTRIAAPLPGAVRATVGAPLAEMVTEMAEELVTLPELSVACAITV